MFGACKNWGKVSKEAAQKFDLERINLKKLSELEVRKWHQIDISNSFTALWNLNDTEDIKRAWESVKENIRFPAKESLGVREWKRHKPWFDLQGSQFLYQRKQAKLHWLQDPNHNNVNVLNNVRHSASRHYRKKRGEYLKAKRNELETNDMIKNIRDLYRGINDFKKGYHCRSNIVKDMVADCDSILSRWRNHFSKLQSVHGANVVRQTEIPIAEPLAPERSAFEVEMAIEREICSMINLLINSEKRNCLSSGIS